MDTNRNAHDFPGSVLSFGPFPPLDEHLVEPEVTRDEIIGGRRTIDLPFDAPEASLKSTLIYLLGFHTASGYVGAVNLLTRFDWTSDFGSDACVYRDGVDPETGTRFLEEIAFEIVSEQNKQDATEKAFWMHRRGVRRVFMVEAKGKQASEWSPENQSWCPLKAGSQIEDPCLVTPLPVAALFDKTAANIAVMNGLAAQGNPMILEAAARSRGATKERAEAVLEVLEERGIAANEAQRQEILDCQDLGRLRRWLRRAVLASSADEVTSA